MARLAVDGRRPRGPGARPGWHEPPRPGRSQASVAGLRIAPAQQDPVVRFALRCARGGATVRHRRPGRRTARAAAGARRAGRRRPPPSRSRHGAALLEHRAALLLGFPAAAATSTSRLAARSGVEARARAHAGVVRGGRGIARARPAPRSRPLLDGDVQPSLPSTLVEAWLVEVWGALRLGDRPAARHALQTALDLAEPMDALRPFALAGQGLRVLLVDQLGGARDPTAFAYRCLAARRQSRPCDGTRAQHARAGRPRPARLPEQPRRDRRRPRGLGQHGQEPRPGHLRQARGEHPPHRRPDRPRARTADVTTSSRRIGVGPDRPADATVVCSGAVHGNREERRRWLDRRPPPCGSRPARPPSRRSPPGSRPAPPLRQRLDEATPGQVVVVSAPAGSGKTLLLADWVRQDEGLADGLGLAGPRRQRPPAALVGRPGRPARALLAVPRPVPRQRVADRGATGAGRRPRRGARRRPRRSSSRRCGSSSTTCTN